MIIYDLCYTFGFLQICSVPIPLEEEQVEVVVFLGEEVAEDTSGISTTDLIGRQAEVNTLDKVPELGHKVLIELPKQKERETNLIAHKI